MQLVHEISSFPEVLNKRGVLKNFSKFTDKQKKQSSVVFYQKMFLKILKISQKNIPVGACFLIKLQRKPETVTSSHWICSIKHGVLKNFENFTGKKTYV